MVAAARARGTGEDPRDRVLAAAFEALRTRGVVGASARAIAETGGFAPGLIFYHFGSVQDLLLATVRRSSEERLVRYRERLADAGTLPRIARAAAELHREDAAGGHVAVLAQVVAGAATSPEQARELATLFDPWIALVQDVLQRVIGDAPWAPMVPTADLAYGVIALFVGAELLTLLGGDADRDDRLFATLRQAAALVDAFLAFGGAPDDDDPDED